MKKSYCSRVKVPFKYMKSYLKFIYNGQDISDNQILKNILKSYSISIRVFELKSNLQYIEGKRIIASFYSNNKKKISDIAIGTLNQIKDIFNQYKFRFYSKGIIYPCGIEIKVDDERTFSEIEIRDNFKFILFGNSLIKKNKK